MSQADLAILISLFSVCLAAISIGWNIYRDVILKAKIVVYLGIRNIVSANTEPSPDYVNISATNHGPGPVVIESIYFKESSLLKKICRKERFAHLMRDYENPDCDELPKKLDVGETVNLFVDFNEECFLQKDVTHVGLTDSFGRIRWAPKKEVKVAKNQWIESFSGNT